jgi:hypothetical protein
MGRAVEYGEQQLAVARRLGDRKSTASAHYKLALALEALGRREEAVGHAEAALHIREEINDPSTARARELLQRWHA